MSLEDSLHGAHVHPPQWAQLDHAVDDERRDGDFANGAYLQFAAIGASEIGNRGVFARPSHATKNGVRHARLHRVVTDGVFDKHLLHVVTVRRDIWDGLQKLSIQRGRILS